VRKLLKEAEAKYR
jgi:hypothetical protein